MKQRITIFILAILVVVALVISSVVTHAPAWEIAYVAFVAILISVYALYWLLRGDNGQE